MMRRVILLAVCLGLTLCLTTSAGAGPEFPILKPGDVKSLMDSGQQFTLLNPLSDLEFNEGHIPGSVNIPLHTLKTTDRLPQDKERVIVTYCLGPK